MRNSEQSKMHLLKEKFITARDWVMDHNKIVMPLVLIVCVLITILVAVNANQREELEREAEQAAMAVASEESEGSIEGLETPVYELEENAYPEINNLVRTYFDAQASGDIETISSLNTYLNETGIIRIQELSKYIESYPVLDVYTKPGLTENTYVAYVYSEVKFQDAETTVPGMQTFYIGLDENGNYFINSGEYDDAVWEYIKEVTLQDDVVDLNNKVVVQYNELLAEDEELSEFIAYLKEKVNEDVGEILAEMEQTDGDGTELADAGTEEAGGENADETQEPETTVITVRATDVVNIRTSDSEQADKIDKAQVGQEFPLLEQRENGWSKVEYNGEEAFIKSEYLEAADVETAETAESTSEEASENTETSETASSAAVTGTVTVKESVRIRKSASTSGESLGTVYAGEVLDVIMEQADGWTKILYDGQTAYVKSEYVE